jgi:2,4-dienoyl-CoA reductase-like NADH-dependent reductase (Old Yellow Enzyme family)
MDRGIPKLEERRMPGLFDPIDIRGLKLKNRLVMAPMATNMATAEGEVTDRHIKHYSARARGGVGLIILEHTFVLKNGKLSAGQMGLYADGLIPGLARLTQAIHKEGAKVAVQLTHAGAKTNRGIIDEQPVGPSNVAPPGSTESPRALTPADIESIALAFADAARRALEAGCDAVELHGAHGFLIGQFLSPYTNRRDDTYGGDLRGRLRFATEVIRGVRSKLEGKLPVFYRFGADDMVEGGLTPDAAKAAAPFLEQAGVDVLDISGGLGGGGSDRFIEQGYFVPLAQGIKETVGIPVIGVGNITEADYADRIVREGRVDLVSLGRKLLSDPEFPRQAAQKLGVKLG